MNRYWPFDLEIEKYMVIVYKHISLWEMLPGDTKLLIQYHRISCIMVPATYFAYTAKRNLD